MPIYRVTWFDYDEAHIGEDEVIFKHSIEEARRSIARRVYQSPHMLPKDTTGFNISWITEDEKLKENI